MCRTSGGKFSVVVSKAGFNPMWEGISYKIRLLDWLTLHFHCLTDIKANVITISFIGTIGSMNNLQFQPLSCDTPKTKFPYFMIEIKYVTS